MATISDLSGDEREQRIAELKRKMQENAKRVKAEHDAEETAASTHTEAELKAEAPVAVAVTDEPVQEDEAEATPVDESTTDATMAADTVVVTSETNGAVAAPPATVADPQTVETDEQEDDGTAEFTRREFLTYAWGAALALLTAESALMSYFFMYPRFRAGEFGGKFFLSATDVPAADAPPAPVTAGKFWLVESDEGPKAIYMVCTHLGCLYKWQASNHRFECPCHGSKFTKDGFYIEGPAPRSLDLFELEEENGQVVVDTGRKITGGPATESPAKAAVS